MYHAGWWVVLCGELPCVLEPRVWELVQQIRLFHPIQMFDYSRARGEGVDDEIRGAKFCVCTATYCVSENFRAELNSRRGFCDNSPSVKHQVQCHGTVASITYLNRLMRYARGVRRDWSIVIAMNLCQKCRIN